MSQDVRRLGFWPKPIPDEPLFSIFGRLKHMLGPTLSRDLIRTAFGGWSGNQIHTHFPLFLDNVIRATSRCAADVEALIDSSTSMPYYSRFIQDGAEGDLRAIMRGSSVAGGRRSFPGPVRKLRYLRYCRACVADDMEQQGMSGWRRVHQFPGVHLCPIHDEWLLSCSDSFWDLQPGFLDRKAIPDDPRTLSRADARFIAAATQFLIDRPSIRQEGLLERALHLTGLTDTRRYNAKKLGIQLDTRFGRAAFEALGIEDVYDVDGMPFLDLRWYVGTKCMWPPLYIAVVLMSGVSIEEFFT